MAAVIIAGVVLGISGVINYAKSGSDGEYFYDLGDEIGEETKMVLDYGVFNDIDREQLITSFLVDYADYIAREEVLFIYGNKMDINALYFQTNQVIGSVRLVTGLNAIPIKLDVLGNALSTAEVTRTQNPDIVNVNIRGITYPFNLKEGENFYFVIIRGDEGERFVAAE